ncbi:MULTISPECIES: pirin family protein [Micromonospora]|uniref:Pirin N-terminal domain-containing protein n=1 Tax=Micromonospora yangpuensis TaxID=683228 RepID=A0A1C6VHC7_9ACTN|nr:pirin-like C-terminal cupin domain-containing protein [Micromonospora yangpuensis]GGL99630.1 quercetin 2,3-dioxygenase [Micromonospora yangpuensis]SCL65695.1 hypothetical protein GA0070617_5841 [Micromonospora yangpuensis]
MSITFSPVVAAGTRHIPGFTALHFIDLEKLEVAASPLAVLDDFRVDGLPFSPHPHAGFAAVTYVFEDSPGEVRSRASSGVDITVGPGGIVWTDAGSGVVHEEVPAVRGRELHGLQLFVNLSARNKSAAPQVRHLQGHEVPQWHSPDGDDRVRVVVGSFKGVSSPLRPTEPFTMLDARIRHEITFDLPQAENAVVYVLDGTVDVHADSQTRQVGTSHALGVRGGGSGGRLTVAPRQSAHLLILSGAEIREPVVTAGPFIMNDAAQVRDAADRYHAGSMGQLTPLSDAG